MKHVFVLAGAPVATFMFGLFVNAVAFGDAPAAPGTAPNAPNAPAANATAANAAAANAAGLPTYSNPGSIHIGGQGQWDYIFVDPATHRLYVTRSTHTQVIDPVAGKVVADWAGGKGLHGVVVVPSAGRAFVSDGKAATLLVFDLKTDQELGQIDAADDADGIIYDAGTSRVLISCGDANQLLVLDPTADIATAAVQKVDLGGKPEFLAADGQGRAFVCLVDKNVIAVVDLKTLKVTDRWPLGTGTGPAGLAIDTKNGRLFVGCRNSKAIVLSTKDGGVQAELNIGKGNDAVTFDPGTGLAFASCYDGTVSVIGEATRGTFAVVQTIQTLPSARTMTVDPSTHILYLPAADALPAEPGKRPKMKPDSFRILTVSPTQSEK